METSHINIFRNFYLFPKPVYYGEPIETKTIVCIDCGMKVETKAWDMKTCRCEECQKLADYTHIETKIIVCVDCGIEFEVDSKANNRERCDDCIEMKKRNDARMRKQKQRQKCK